MDNRVMSEEKEFYSRLKTNLEKDLAALFIRYHVEVNPVNRTKIHHIIRRLESVVDEIEDHLKPYWEV